MSNAWHNLKLDALEETQRRLRDALYLAIAAGAPMALLEKLASASALLNALAELGKQALIPEVLVRAHRALRAWQEWRRETPPQGAA